MPMPLSVFVTGIAGFLGSHLAERLLSLGHTVSGCDTLAGGEEGNVPVGATWTRHDCNDREAMIQVLSGVDLVYHCAAHAHEGLSVFSPHVIAQNVLTATTGILSAAAHVGVKRFVYCSSMARYGSNIAPFEEWMWPRPVDPYGIAKVAAEEMVRHVGNTHGMEWVIAVPHNIIGPRQKYDDPFRNVAAIFINRMLRGKPPILYGGAQTRCFSDVKDCVSPLVEMGTLPRVAGEIINIGPDEGTVTMMRLAEMLASLLGVPHCPIVHPGRVHEVVHATCSADKARRVLGYTPETHLETTLQAMIEDIRRRGPKPFSYHVPVEIESERLPVTWRSGGMDQ